jgi:hypothetical protein
MQQQQQQQPHLDLQPIIEDLLPDDVALITAL